MWQVHSMCRKRTSGSKCSQAGRGHRGWCDGAAKCWRRGSAMICLAAWGSLEVQGLAPRQAAAAQSTRLCGQRLPHLSQSRGRARAHPAWRCKGARPTPARETQRMKARLGRRAGAHQSGRRAGRVSTAARLPHLGPISALVTCFSHRAAMAPTKTSLWYAAQRN